jgi:hypothetical protein
MRRREFITLIGGAVLLSSYIWIGTRCADCGNASRAITSSRGALRFAIHRPARASR